VFKKRIVAFNFHTALTVGLIELHVSSPTAKLNDKMFGIGPRQSGGRSFRSLLTKRPRLPRPIHVFTSSRSCSSWGREDSESHFSCCFTSAVIRGTLVILVRLSGIECDA
jgi:hypothetical protein